MILLPKRNSGEVTKSNPHPTLPFNKGEGKGGVRKQLLYFKKESLTTN